jgi:allantoinase
MHDLILRSRRVVMDGGVGESAILVRYGKIAAIAEYGARLDADADLDLGDLALLPGLVDTHVHVNEPGRTDWEGFATATRAAAAGGVTTICDMPLNSLPPTVSVAALRDKLAAAAGQCAVDVAFWGGAVPGNVAELKPLYDAGVVGFKCFLTDSGVPEFPPLSAGELRSAMAEIAGLEGAGEGGTGRWAGGGVPIIVHAEDPDETGVPHSGSYDDFLASRPPVSERRAIETVIRASAATGARAHIVHLSAAECAALLSGAKAAGVAITAETCPHYLYFAAEEIQGNRTEFKCCPPLRPAVNREALWRALGAGVIDYVVSDHSPCLPDLKAGDFASAWGGIASLQLGLSIVWTVASRRSPAQANAVLADVARWMAAGPASLAGLPTKGRIAVGCDADLIAFDPAASFTVRGAELAHRHALTPYDGRTLTGRVERVWLGGVEVEPDGEPRGRLLRKGASVFGEEL